MGAREGPSQGRVPARSLAESERDGRALQGRSRPVFALRRALGGSDRSVVRLSRGLSTSLPSLLHPVIHSHILSFTLTPLASRAESRDPITVQTNTNVT